MINRYFHTVIVSNIHKRTLCYHQQFKGHHHPNKFHKRHSCISKDVLNNYQKAFSGAKNRSNLIWKMNRTGNSNHNRSDIDWSKYGLGTEATAQRVHANTTGFVDLSNDYEAGGGHQASGANEIFAEVQGEAPWWKSNFFISQPVLFGTWDGVFTTCLINIFGVIVFLRSGWIVAQAGIFSAVLIVLATVLIALISVLSAVGICERCRIESGGVYFVSSHVLGSRIGGSMGLLYCFGQAVGCALNALGFGESIAQLLGLGDSTWALRIIACTAVSLLSIINVAGVKWVIKLQFILLVILLLSGLDFIVGTFVHTDPENGFDGWLQGNFGENFWSNYTENYDSFSVFGVFFPTITGILSGINMSGDLVAPSINIPNGTLAAITTGTILYMIFVIFLGGTCKRNYLLNDFMIAAKVSAIRVLLLAGLYVSSMSSCLGAMYGTPRVLQSIALENVIPRLRALGNGRGPNKVPIYSLIVVAVITLGFILIGEINTLAPIVTMPYLLTYACIDYAYFALAQSFDIQSHREQRFQRQKPQTDDNNTANDNNDPDDEMFTDLDHLFPERIRHKAFRMLRKSDSSSLTPSTATMTSSVATTPTLTTATTISTINDEHYSIHSKPHNWYSFWCNRWFSLFGALLKILIMLLVNWLYAIICLGVGFLIWIYIGTANPAVKPGLSAEFHLFVWIKSLLLKCFGKKTYDYEQIVVQSGYPDLRTTPTQLNEDNEDFPNRRRYHQSAVIHGHAVFIDE